MKPYLNLGVDFVNVTTLKGLREILLMLKSEWEANCDPVAGFMIGTGIQSFKSSLSKQFFERLDLFSNEDIYFSGAFRIFSRDAELGNPAAARWVSQYYLNGVPPVTVDLMAHKMWLERAADLGDLISKAELNENG